MASVIMRDGAENSFGEVVGNYKVTKADKKLVDEMEREFLKGTTWVRIDDPKK